MTAVSAMVTNWTAIVRSVVSSIETHVDTIAPGLERDVFPGQEPTGRVRDMHLGKAAMLKRKLATLQELDRVVARERGDNPGVGAAERAAHEALRDRVMRTRSAIRSKYDEPVVARLTLTGETPEDPDALIQYAATARDSLRREPLPEIEEEEGITLDPEALAAQLDRAIDTLRAALDADATEDRQEQGSVADRDEAERDLARTYTGVADGFAADCILGGRPDIAEDVRPTARRRKGEPEERDLLNPSQPAPAVDPAVVDPAEPPVVDPTEPNDPLA